MLHWVGAGILIVVSSSTLSILYLLFSWYFFKDQLTKKQNLAISITTGLVLSIALTGILFKLQIWSGTKGILTIGTFGTLIMALIVFIKRNKQVEMIPYYTKMLSRIILIGCITIVLYFLPTKQLIKIYYRDDPEYVKLFIMAHENPNNSEYQKAFQDYLDKKNSRQE